MMLQMWQIGTILTLAFLLGWRIGSVQGDTHGYQARDDEARLTRLAEQQQKTEAEEAEQQPEPEP